MRNSNIFRGLSGAVVLLLTTLLPLSVATAGGAVSISGQPATTAMVGQPYVFRASAVDNQGDRVWFSIANRPPWMTFDWRTGELSGTPKADNVGIWDNIAIQVSDGAASASLQPFRITVVPENIRPTIKGAPKTDVAIGARYRFRPVGEDADGDELHYLVLNKPAWAEFDNRSGKLYGAPGKGDVGDYDNIQIYVTDRKSYVSLPAFRIRVTGAVSGAAPTGSAAVSWNPPAGRADGTALAMSEIGGYKVYYGTEKGRYRSSLKINGGYRTSAVVSGLPANTYYLAVTTVDVDGRESAYSKEVVKVVSPP